MTSDVVVLEPVVSWPREVELGRNYLVTVDIRSAAGLESWPYDEEQFELSCVLDAQPYLDTNVIDDPVLVLHRFGGTYRPVRFVVSAQRLPPHEGLIEIWLSYVNRWGVVLRTVPLQLTISSQRDVTAQPSDLAAPRVPRRRSAAARNERVTELYAPAVRGGGGRAGSGYLVGPGVVLTAAHVAADLPFWAAGDPMPADVDEPGVCWARPLGELRWVPAVVVWRDEAAGVAVLRLGSSVPPLPTGSAAPRWGRVDGSEPVAVSAVGIPSAQEHPDRVRDAKQLFGFITPDTTARAGLYAMTVLTASSVDPAADSPWEGMSGAALFAGPFLLGVVVVDPPRFGTDRVVATPIAPLLGDTELAGLLGVSPEHVVGVGPRFRLAVTAETSVTLAPPYRAATPRLGREPARLLLPEYGIVPFVGRDGDLETLEAWCENDAASALRVVLGAGGSGKTRLAAEACVRMASEGWQAGFADPQAPSGPTTLELDRPTLLVIDDADLNVTLLADLVRVVAYSPPGTPPFRLLLLARHITGWWDALNQRTDHLAAELADSPLMLHDGELTTAERTEHHTRALTAFAAYMPNAVEPAEQAPPLLADAAFANPLLVHMHALLTVSGAQLPVTGTAVRERLLDAILDSERDRWTATFPTGFSAGGAQQAVTVATLFAPPTETATADILTIIGELARDGAAGTRAAVATWLRELSPGSDPPWVAPLRPYPLAEQLLATCPQLTDLVLAGYPKVGTPGQLEQLLTELTRADTRTPVRQALDRLLKTHVPDLLTAAMDAPSSRLPDLLGLALTHCPQTEVAATLVSRLPARSTGLAALAATLTSQAVDYHRQLAATRPDELTPDLAMSLNTLALRLADLGRREEALAAIEEAVSLRRQLAAARPEAFTPDLAASLNTLANALAGLGRREDALAAIEEAVSLRRQLAAARPEAFTPDLAASLNTLALRLADLGRREDALAAIEEAVTVYRQLAAARPEAFTPDLAASLNTLALRLADLGRREDALAAIEEAVTVYRQLAAARPDAFTPDLAASLNTLALRLADLGRREDALAAIEEAVTVYRQLAAARPEAFTPDLAMSLNTLANVLADLGRYEDALAAIEEAITLYRQLAAARPEAFTPDLAASLNTLANALAGLGRREDALAAIEEAVTLYRQLAAARPEAFTPDLAMSLNTLANALAGLGRREDALAAIEEAVTLYRQLAAARPEAFTPDLAASLNTLANALAGLGRREDALAAIEEAVTVYRQLAAARPEAFTPDLAMSLNTLANVLADLGRYEDALAAIEEAITLYRQLAAARPEAFTPDLAASLNTLANALAGLGRREDALAAIEEAVTLRRQLAAARPDAFTPDLAASLNTLANALAGLGRREDALAAIEEAVTLYRQLAAARPEAFTPDLAASLNTLANALAGLGRREDAATAANDRTRLLNERFTAIAAQLGDDQPAVRLAGAHAMADLADRWEEKRQTCVDVLCTYLRTPQEPEPSADAPEPERLAFRASREVRHAVIRVITTHLRHDAALSWQGLNFDFTGAVFDGGDFRAAVFSDGEISFDSAQFSGGQVSFDSAQFSGGQVSFDSAQFSGGQVSFNGAQFSGGQVSFNGAQFSGGQVSFNGAQFSGGQVSFNGAQFSGGQVSFNSAQFSGGQVSFDSAGFSGAVVDFTDAYDWSHPPTFGREGVPPTGVKLPAGAVGQQLQ